MIFIGEKIDFSDKLETESGSIITNDQTYFLKDRFSAEYEILGFEGTAKSVEFVQVEGSGAIDMVVLLNTEGEIYCSEPLGDIYILQKTPFNEKIKAISGTSTYRWGYFPLFITESGEIKAISIYHSSDMKIFDFSMEKEKEYGDIYLNLCNGEWKPFYAFDNKKATEVSLQSVLGDDVKKSSTFYFGEHLELCINNIDNEVGMYTIIPEEQTIELCYDDSGEKKTFKYLKEYNGKPALVVPYKDDIFVYFAKHIK